MFKRLFFIIMISVSYNMYSQKRTLVEDIGFRFVQPSFNVASLEVIDWFETRLFSLTKRDFLINSSFRIDEEVPYTATNKAKINELYFFDLDLSYRIKNIMLSLTIENVLNITGNNFEIESEYADVYQSISVFTQQSDTLLSISLVYSF